MLKKNKIKSNRIKLLRLRPYLIDQLDFFELLKLSEQMSRHYRLKNDF